MLASETRKLARESLYQKWGKAALATLVYFLITWAIDFIFNFIPIIGSIVKLLVEIPLSFGFIATLMKLKRGEEITYTEFLNTGFNNFASSWKVALWTIVKMIVPIILIIVSIVVISVGIVNSTTTNGLFANAPIVSSSSQSNLGIITLLVGLILFIGSSIWGTLKSYYYKPALFILFDNPSMDAKEIVEESERIMTGNRWKFFCLELSFIGWYLLIPFSLGIGMLWLLPYVVIAEVIFYEYIAGKNPNVVKTTTISTEETNTEIPTEQIEESLAKDGTTTFAEETEEPISTETENSEDNNDEQNEY